MYCVLGKVDVGKFVSTQKCRNDRYEDYLRQSLTLHDARRQVREEKFSKLRPQLTLDDSPKVEKKRRRIILSLNVTLRNSPKGKEVVERPKSEATFSPRLKVPKTSQLAKGI